MKEDEKGEPRASQRRVEREGPLGDGCTVLLDDGALKETRLFPSDDLVALNV